MSFSPVQEGRWLEVHRLVVGALTSSCWSWKYFKWQIACCYLAPCVTVYVLVRSNPSWSFARTTSDRPPPLPRGQPLTRDDTVTSRRPFALPNVMLVNRLNSITAQKRRQREKWVVLLESRPGSGNPIYTGRLCVRACCKYLSGTRASASGRVCLSASGHGRVPL